LAKLLPELSTAMIPYVPALVGLNPWGLTPGFHPTIVPSSVANRNAEFAVVGALVLLKPETGKLLASAVLKIEPVGVPPPVASGGVEC
jgi:hypothetical protein